MPFLVSAVQLVRLLVESELHLRGLVLLQPEPVVLLLVPQEEKAFVNSSVEPLDFLPPQA
jgi:hypothetical protein